MIEKNKKLRILSRDDKNSLTSIVLSHAAGLKRFAFSLCKNENDSEDLVAETVLKAFENFHRLKDRSKIKSWLFRILNNHFISIYRSKKKFVDLDFYTGNNSDEEYPFSLFEEIARSNFVDEGNPEKKFISELTQQDINQAIRNLPDEFKQTLVLRDIEDFSYTEIAVITKVPIGTVRSRIARARSILQKKLWIHAQELGIKKSKESKIKSDYTCTCGTEETMNIISK